MTQSNNANHALSNVTAQLRKLTPKRALTYGESLTIAKLQAHTARTILGITSPAASLEWALRLPRVQVKLLAAHQILEIANGDDASGFTTRAKDGSYVIGINKNNSHTHRRFTLAHELKHLLDYPYAKTLHAKLGRGNAELHVRQVERICDHFAAHFLAPSMLLKRAWSRGIQDVPALAALFTVSAEAMHIRLENEGFIDTDPRPIATYFRRSALVMQTQTAYMAA
ncbi:MAG: ImmA/IrrE family metallo-endopeptidase [Pyrinomonadaceae bacterium]